RGAGPPGRAGDGDGIVPVGQAVPRILQRRLALQDQVDLDEVGVGGPPFAALLQVCLPALARDLVRRADDVHQRDQAVVGALADLEVILAVFLPRDGSEQHLLDDVVPLRQAGGGGGRPAGRQGGGTAGGEGGGGTRP